MHTKVKSGDMRAVGNGWELFGAGEIVSARRKNHCSVRNRARTIRPQEPARNYFAQSAAPRHLVFRPRAQLAPLARSGRHFTAVAQVFRAACRLLGLPLKFDAFPVPSGWARVRDLPPHNRPLGFAVRHPRLRRVPVAAAIAAWSPECVTRPRRVSRKD
jgi:hypothetical protein